jgi:hypothetical protein
MADILAEKALNTLAKFLHAVHIALVHLPLDAGTRLEGRDLLIHSEVPGDVSHQILDDGECLHWKDGDGLIQWKRVHACLASEPWTAIDLGRTRAAFARLAIPANGEVWRLVRLDRMQRIEHDHPRNERYSILNGFASFPVTPEDLQRCLCHRDISHG